MSQRPHESGPASSGLGYWMLNYRSSSFYREELSFRDVAPALYVGLTGYIGYPHRSFDELLPRLRLRYDHVRGDSPLPWEQAVPIAREAWERARAEVRGAGR